MKYYHQEHLDTYSLIREQGHDQWNDLFDDEWTYERFQNRSFLEYILPSLSLAPPEKIRVLEYGCGTGPAACYLANLGFNVVAFDLVPDAIVIAREKASERDLNIDFQVGDVCDPDENAEYDRFDIVLDSFCLQSIVTDQDRARLFSFVRQSLRPDGYYLISTAIYSPDREYGSGYYYDQNTGVAYIESDMLGTDDQAIEINGMSYAPHRRHVSPEMLQNELEIAGFEVVSMTVQGWADVVCRLSAHND